MWMSAFVKASALSVAPTPSASASAAPEFSSRRQLVFTPAEEAEAFAREETSTLLLDRRGSRAGTPEDDEAYALPEMEGEMEVDAGPPTDGPFPVAVAAPDRARSNSQVSFSHRPPPPPPASPPPPPLPSLPPLTGTFAAAIVWLIVPFSLWLEPIPIPVPFPFPPNSPPSFGRKDSDCDMDAGGDAEGLRIPPVPVPPSPGVPDAPSASSVVLECAWIRLIMNDCVSSMTCWMLDARWKSTDDVEGADDEEVDDADDDTDADKEGEEVDIGCDEAVAFTTPPELRSGDAVFGPSRPAPTPRSSAAPPPGKAPLVDPPPPPPIDAVALVP